MPLLESIFGFLIFTVIAVFVSGIYTGFKDRRLNKYLKEKNYERWREITSIGNVGPGAVNPFRGFAYLYGQKDNDNETVLRLKDSVKIGFRYILISLLTMIVTLATFLYVLTNFGN